MGVQWSQPTVYALRDITINCPIVCGLSKNNNEWNVQEYIYISCQKQILSLVSLTVSLSPRKFREIGGVYQRKTYKYVEKCTVKTV
jgi:hypothetical protein